MGSRILNFSLTIGLIAFAASPAFAAGYYNLPGNFCQCFGYGNGGGYHACFVLGPSNCQGFCDPHDVRVAYPPQPPCNYCGYGQSSGGCYGGEYHRTPEMAPPAEPQPQPAQAALRPQFLRIPPR